MIVGGRGFTLSDKYLKCTINAGASKGNSSTFVSAFQVFADFLAVLTLKLRMSLHSVAGDVLVYIERVFLTGGSLVAVGFGEG